VNQTFDIFKRLLDGQPEWVEAVEGLEEARTCVASLSSNSPAEYFIYSVADQRVVSNSQVTTEDVPIQMIVFVGAGLP
jgi:hypothetical protein